MRGAFSGPEDSTAGAYTKKPRLPSDIHCPDYVQSVLYISRKLNKHEVWYSSVEKECLAIKWALLRYYLLGPSGTVLAEKHEGHQFQDNKVVCGHEAISL